MARARPGLNGAPRPAPPEANAVFLARRGALDSPDHESDFSEHWMIAVKSAPGLRVQVICRVRCGASEFMWPLPDAVSACASAAGPAAAGPAAIVLVRGSISPTPPLFDFSVVVNGETLCRRCCGPSLGFDTA